MAKRKSTKQAVQNEVKKVVRRQLGRRGGILGLLFVAILFLIGIFNPELRDRIADQIGVSNGTITTEDDKPLPSTKKSPLKEGVWPVVHVADGDTIDVQDDRGTTHRIRLVGADTPEVHRSSKWPHDEPEPFGPEASAFTKTVIQQAGGQVRVAFDGDQIDRYDRNLAMIYVETDQGEVCLNEALIRQGLAKAQTQYRFSKGAKERFRQAEEEAQQARRNLWSR